MMDDKVSSRYLREYFDTNEIAKINIRQMLDNGNGVLS